jgi:small subunit ribosomal protein S9
VIERPEDERQDEEPAAADQPSDAEAPPLEETHASHPDPADAAPSSAAQDEASAAQGEPSVAQDEPSVAQGERSVEPPAPTSAEPEPPAEDQTPEPTAAQVPPDSAAAETAAGEPPAQAGPAAEPPPLPGTEDAARAPAAEDAARAPAADEELDEEELAPREKPEIPGADLIPDIVPEGEQFLDAEAQAAAEAEAEAAAAREAEEPEDQALPIADAAIDLAAGARYTATGKRKTSVARVILKPGNGDYKINGKALEVFFPRETLQRMIRQPLETVGYESRMDVVARMHGGGVAAQAGALRHGISRALIVADPNLRGELKRRGFLTRDPRVKERKKAGLKKARKRPQFSKR